MEHPGTITVKLDLDTTEAKAKIAAIMGQTPGVGRIVHYHSYGTPGGEYLPEARAAVITSVNVRIPDGWDGGGFPVSLCVLNPTGMFFNELVPYAEKPTPGHWSWPPRN